MHPGSKEEASAFIYQPLYSLIPSSAGLIILRFAKISLFASTPVRARSIRWSSSCFIFIHSLGPLGITCPSVCAKHLVSDAVRDFINISLFALHSLFYDEDKALANGTAKHIRTCLCIQVNYRNQQHVEGEGRICLAAIIF